MKSEQYAPAEPTPAPDRPRRRRLPTLPAAMTTALLTTTALTAAFDTKLPPYKGD